MMFRIAAAAGCAFLLAACNTVVPYKDVYDGLLPAGHKLDASPQRLRADQLKTGTVVLVTTTNFNTYTSTWQSHWEKGGAEARQERLQGAAAALAIFAPGGQAAGFAQGLAAGGSGGGVGRVRESSDPRHIVNRVYAALQPHFGKVKAASDFAEALEMKADYIALIDYYGTFNEMGDRYRTRGGVYLLDGSLRRVFEAQGSADVERPEGSLFSGVDEQYSILSRTYTRGLDVTMGQVLAETRQRLGGSR